MTLIVQHVESLRCTTPLFADAIASSESPATSGGDTADFAVMAYALHVLARDERVTLNPEQVEAVTFRWRTLVQLTDRENDAPLRP